MNSTAVSHFSDPKLIFDHAVIKEPDNKYYLCHTHERIEILYLVRGMATYVVEDKSYDMKEQWIYMVSPGVEHRVKFDNAAVYERYDILPDESILPCDAVERIMCGRDFAEIRVTEAIREMLARMDSYYLRLSLEELKQMYYAVMQELVLNLVFEAQRPSIEYNNTENRIIANALKYIDENIKEISDVGEICRSLFVSRSYFYHIFMRATNTSPKDYVRNKRLTLARNAIRYGKKPTEVYAEVGFSDYTTFFRAYKTMFGYPPSKESTTGKNSGELLT